MGSEQALAVWRPQVCYAAGLLLKSLVDKSHQWWCFLEHPEVSPDNNRAERSLRVGYQEFANRGILIALVVAVLGGAAKLFGFFLNP